MQKLRIKLLLSPFFLLALASPPLTAGAQAPCHLLTSASPIPEGFGAAYNLFSSAKEPLLKVDCGPMSEGKLQVGNGEDALYIHKTGYEWTGSSWRPLAMSGQTPAGDWFVGSAETTIVRSEVELAQNNFVVAYTCLRTKTEWKCGCRDTACAKNYWQLQVFQYAPQLMGPDEPAVASRLKQQYPRLYNQDLPHMGLFYGQGYSGDQHAHLRLYPTRQHSARFRAERSGTLVSVGWHNRWGCNSKGICAYDKGTGGIIHGELRLDDGNGRPGILLAKTKAYIPKQASGGNGFPNHAFEQPVEIQAGKIYHVVIDNTHSTDWASTNMLDFVNCVTELPGGPYYGHDNRVLVNNGRGWRLHKTSLQNSCVLPWVYIKYSDGVQMSTGSGGFTIGKFSFGGSTKVRERFTLIGPTRRVNGMWARIAREGSSPLTIDIKAGGTTLMSISVPASTFDGGSFTETGSPVGWRYVAFPRMVVLESGKEYSIELSTSGSFSMRKRSDFAARNQVGPNLLAWNGGTAEISSGGGWQGITGEGSPFDLDILFTLEGGPKSITSMLPQGQ